MKHGLNTDFGEQLQVLANQLARANTHYHFARTLHENRQKLGWAKDFWEYTITAHCSTALLDLCLVYDYHKKGLNLINCLQSIDKKTLDRASQNQLNVYTAECCSQTQNPLVKSLRTWRHEIVAHYSIKAALDRDDFDKRNPIEPEEIIISLIKLGFTILEWCACLADKTVSYQKFAPGKDDFNLVLRKMKHE